jgi:hypothetical protein
MNKQTTNNAKPKYNVGDTVVTGDCDKVMGARWHAKVHKVGRLKAGTFDSEKDDGYCYDTVGTWEVLPECQNPDIFADDDGIPTLRPLYSSHLEREAVGSLGSGTKEGES